jgi:hypothetical protein
MFVAGNAKALAFGLCESIPTLLNIFDDARCERHT